MKRCINIVVLLLLLVLPISVNAKSGCCSHHGGVSGCDSSGKQICNDGTLSPTCECTPTASYTYGCMDSSAKNYNANANKDDGSCEFKKQTASVVKEEKEEPKDSDSVVGGTLVIAAGVATYYIIKNLKNK